MSIVLKNERNNMKKRLKLAAVISIVALTACGTVNVQESQQKALSQTQNINTRSQSIDIHFLSKDPFDVATAAVGKVNEVTVRGTLLLPPGKGPFPAVVISNSSAGIHDRVGQSLATDLVSAGYATFSIQSLEARGQATSGSNQAHTTLQSHGVDALYALEYLRTLPVINPEKICVTGHSRGAIAALDFTYFQSFLDMSGYVGKPFNCNIAVLAGWHMVPVDKTTTGKPALVFLGEKDDLWHPQTNIDWINQLKNNGNDVTLVVLKETYHGLGTSAQFCPDHQTPRKCTEQTAYDKMGIYKDGKLISRSGNYKACVTYGYHCRSQTMDKYQEVKDTIIAFLNKNIGTSQ